MNKITVVTDSTAYLPRLRARALGVRVVPLSYTMGGTVLIEAFPGENGDYIRLLKEHGAIAKTAQASMSAFMSVFNELVREGEQVICLTISSRLSGTYSSACAAAKAVSPENIAVVDSLTTVYGLTLLVERAATLAREGEELLDIARDIESYRERIGTVFSVESLDALRRGGRLGIVRQSISTILNVRPLLLCRDGVIVSDGVVQGRSGLVRELCARVPEGAKKIGVMHISTPEIALRLQQQLRETHPDAPIVQWDVGPVIGIHLGISATGVSWEE